MKNKSIRPELRSFQLFIICSTILILVFWAVKMSINDFYNKTWQLKNGIIIKFSRKNREPKGRDDIKILEIIYRDNERIKFEFGAWHAGYNNVELRSTADENIIWIVDRSNKPSLGPSFDFIKKSFKDEGEKHPSVVGINYGKLVLDCKLPREIAHLLPTKSAKN